MSQIHKRFTNKEIRELIERYLRKEIKRKYLQEIFGVGKSRFFVLIHSYRRDPDNFSI